MEHKLIDCGFAVNPVGTEYCEINIDECFWNNWK